MTVQWMLEISDSFLINSEVGMILSHTQTVESINSCGFIHYFFSFELDINQALEDWYRQGSNYWKINKYFVV